MSRVIFFLMICLAMAVSSSNGAEPKPTRVAMFADAEFTTEQYRFTPYDKIYLVLDFTNAAPGEYNLAVDWITPFGNLERQTTHTLVFSEEVPSQQVYFWFKLLRRGPLKRTLSGREYKEEFYGEWKANCYVDGILLASKTFDIH